MALPYLNAAGRQVKGEAQNDAERELWETTDPARALVEYARLGDLGKVESLLRAGADPNEDVLIDIKVDAITDTPLGVAARHGHLDVVKSLVEAGAAVDNRLEDNFTALIYAAMYGRPQVVDYLLSKGADIHAREDIFGQTALHKAARLGRPGAVDALIAAGADMSLQDDAGLAPDQMVCEQYGGTLADRQPAEDAIRKSFDAYRARLDAAAAARAEAANAYARELAQAAVLQKDVTVHRVPASLRRRGGGPRP